MVPPLMECQVQATTPRSCGKEPRGLVVANGNQVMMLSCFAITSQEETWVALTVRMFMPHRAVRHNVADEKKPPWKSFALEVIRANNLCGFMVTALRNPQICFMHADVLRGGVQQSKSPSMELAYMQVRRLERRIRGSCSGSD